jgi:hypothetical protein
MAEEENGIPAFPDITPSKITHSVMHIIEEFDIKTKEDFKGLIHQMFDHPERDFYYFQEKDGPKNLLMITKEETGHILMDETEFFFYKHPKFKRDYVQIEIHDGQYKWDWQRDLVEKGPMFMRTKLRLPERTRRELETWHRLQLEEEFRRRRQEAENNFDVFISHASADSNEANQIHDAIVAAGGRAFLAGKNLRPGEDFAEEIRQALVSSRELWLLVSPNSLGSNWVLSEWGAAWALGKKIVPVLHRCSPEQLPDRIRRLQCIDFYKYADLVTQAFPAKEWKLTHIFKPKHAPEMVKLDEFMAHLAHQDPKQGFVYPDPDTGKKWLVFCKTYERDDSDPNLRKRRVMLVHINDKSVSRPDDVL